MGNNLSGYEFNLRGGSVVLPDFINLLKTTPVKKRNIRLNTSDNTLIKVNYTNDGLTIELL